MKSKIKKYLSLLKKNKTEDDQEILQKSKAHDLRNEIVKKEVIEEVGFDANGSPTIEYAGQSIHHKQ